MSGRHEVDVGERVQLAKFECFTARRDSGHCRKLCSIVFKLTFGPTPPNQLNVTHVMNSPKPSPFFTLPLLCIIVNTNQRTRNGVGLGTRLYRDDIEGGRRGWTKANHNTTPLQQAQLSNDQNEV